MRKILDRLKEPSTWVAIGATFTAFGIAADVTQETWGQIGTGIAALVTAIGAFLPERGAKE